MVKGEITNQEFITIALIVSLVLWGYMFIKTIDCKTMYDNAVSNCTKYCVGMQGDTAINQSFLENPMVTAFYNNQTSSLYNS